MMVTVLLQFCEMRTFRLETACLEALEWLESEFDCIVEIEATGGRKQPFLYFRSEGVGVTDRPRYGCLRLSTVRLPTGAWRSLLLLKCHQLGLRIGHAKINSEQITNITGQDLGDHVTHSRVGPAVNACESNASSIC